MDTKTGVNRRRFLAGAGMSAAAFHVLKPGLAQGYQANQKIKLGLMGCGGRGTWISRLFQQNGNYEIHACSDYFEDRVNAYGDRFNVPEANRFDGLAGYKRMLDRGIVDAIAVESPPYFHPEQAAAGVEAGLHVYVAKPIGIDVPGCLSIEASGKNARANKQCFLIDFQTRADQYYIEALRRVRNGDLGEFAFGESTYHAGCPWTRQFETWKEIESNPAARLRAWGLDKTLSGDIITEQNIHTLDVCSWIMDEPPIQASGSCALKVRGIGECSDCFTLTFEYPNNVGIAFSSRQFEGYESSGGIRNRMFGSKGVLETAYGGDVLIRGEKPYAGGKSPGIFTDGAATNIADFHKNIVDGNYANVTVEPSVRSNLVTILGRTAAYTGEIVRWDDLLRKKEKLTADFKGLKE